MQHYIKKQILDLRVNKRLDPFAVQQQVSDHYWRDLVPVMEKLFEQLSVEAETIKLDELEIDLGIISEEMIDTGNWAALFQKKLKERRQ